MARSRDGALARVAPRRLLLALGPAAIVLGAAACAESAPEPERSGAAAGSPNSPEGASAPDPSTPQTGSTSPNDGQRDAMDIQIAIAGQRFRATLVESAAARDLLAQLPATIDMRDHGGVEKTGRLPSPLSSAGQPEGADPVVGDVGYYAPSGDLVLYYGDQSYYPGIVVLGRLHGDAAARIAELDGPVTVVVATQS